MLKGAVNYLQLLTTTRLNGREAHPIQLLLNLARLRAEPGKISRGADRLEGLKRAWLYMNDQLALCRLTSACCDFNLNRDHDLAVSCASLYDAVHD